MSYAGSRLMAAAFRSIGVDAHVAPDSDADTLELGGLKSSGEECLPHKITLGDFLKVCRAPDFHPDKVAFFMPTAHGPCRFGQYAPYLRKILDELGYGDVPVFSPSSKDGYDGIGEHAGQAVRIGWMGLVAGDIATKFMLKIRPYERIAGDTDEVFHESLEALCGVVAQPGMTLKAKLASLAVAVARMRDRFRGIPANYVKGRPLIGLVGEIFCRLHTFSNDDLARRVERHGGECWLSDIAEWVWYTNWSQAEAIKVAQGRLNLEYLKLKIKTHVQRKYENALLAPVADDMVGYEEPHDVRDVLDVAEPYLPAEGSLGEMVLSVGKAVYLYGKGADGIIDISPFTCMNGIISEAVYPAVSAAHDNLPIRVCYFDGVNSNVDRDLEIFLDLARAYQKRKHQQRVYPAFFR
jgi:predicted nucleotide-binding protein (sugar kinase/HSP70/actin superfamily)